LTDYGRTDCDTTTADAVDADTLETESPAERSAMTTKTALGNSVGGKVQTPILPCRRRAPRTDGMIDAP